MTALLALLGILLYLAVAIVTAAVIHHCGLERDHCLAGYLGITWFISLPILLFLILPSCIIGWLIKKR